jgi:hypothetical protein
MLQKWYKLQIKVTEGVDEKYSRHPILPYVPELPHIFGERYADIMVTGVSSYSAYKFTYLCITEEERSFFVINSSSSVQGLQVLSKFLHSILLGNCNLECAVLTYICSYTGQ